LDRSSLLLLVKGILGDDVIQEKGEALFNSLETLAPNDVYLAGFNPGGVGHRTIEEDITREQGIQKGWSKLDEPWANRLYGKRTKALLDRLGYDYHCIFITNTFFSASPTQFMLPEMSQQQIMRYGKLHQHLLSIVNPRFVICLGQETFRCFREWAIERSPVRDESLEDGRFYFARYPGTRQALLIGTPHPSRGSFVSQKFYKNFSELRADQEKRDLRPLEPTQAHTYVLHTLF